MYWKHNHLYSTKFWEINAHPYNNLVSHDIEDCKYVYEHGIGNLCFGNNNGELGMILVNIRSIYKNFDRLVVLLGKFKKKAGNYLYIGD